MTLNRFIHSEMFTSEDFTALSPHARILWIGLFGCIADDEGRGKAGPGYLKSSIFPADSFKPSQVAGWLGEISARGMIQLYRDSEGRDLFQIPSWQTWQRPKYTKSSKFPEINDKANSAGIGEKPATGRDGKGRVGLGREGLGTGTAKKPPRQPTEFQTCLETFSQRHIDTLGLPYDCTKYSRDNKTLNGPLRTYGLPAVLEMIGYFWDEQREREKGNETWIGKATPHIPGFVSKIPLILRDYTVESYGKETEQRRPEGRVSSIREGPTNRRTEGGR